MPVREWLTRLLGTFRPSRRDEDLEAELRSHLELSAEAESRRSEMIDDDARVAALENGPVAQTMEAMRDQRGLPWLDDLSRDLRHGARTLRRSPTFTAVALLTLAIGIGANTAVFSVLNGILLKPLPYPRSDDLVAVWHVAPGAEGLAAVSGDLRLSASMYFTYAEQNRAFEHIGIWYPYSATVTGVSEPEQVRSVVVSDGVLQALAVPPLVGRPLAAADQVPDGPATMLLTAGYWQRRFGGDPGVVGRIVQVDSLPREIVGVMPANFRIADQEADLILPARFDRRTLTLPGFGFQSIARLKPGVTIADANADIARLVPIWMDSWPMFGNLSGKVYESWRIAPAVRPLKQDVVGKVGETLWILMGTLAIVMLIACANVATLLLVRAEARHQELAIRAALGAGSGRIVRALLVESVLLGLSGGLFGLAFAFAGLRALVALAPAGLPRVGEIAIDSRVLLFTITISLLSGIVFGLIPALRHKSPQISAGLGAGGRTAGAGRTGQRTRTVLVVAQLALALVLLVSSGLMIRTFLALRAVQPGFVEPDRVQVFRIAIPRRLVPEPERVGRLEHDLVNALSGIAGVESAAFATTLPIDGMPVNWDAVQPDYKADTPIQGAKFLTFKDISPDFLRTMGTTVVSGRSFSWTDLYERRRVVMISEGLAREFWGTAPAAVGRRVRTLPTAPWQEVIGIVQDVHDNGVDQPPASVVYWPVFGENAYRAGEPRVNRLLAYAVRSRRAGTESFLHELHTAVWSVNGNLSLASVETMGDLYRRSLARTSFTLVMLAIAGLMALTLGIVGIYGVIAYAVSQRTREIGIRVALGAQRSELTQMFVRSGLMLAGIGVPLGLVAALVLTRLMSAVVFGVSLLDPVTYVAVPLVLVTAVVVASYLPARRAASVDPVDALKAD
ncbi:MAG TPA: ABC transporter permease [Vicinamibacterales bacterium]